MGISLLTALTIQNNEVICDAGGPAKDTGKYVGWIMKDEDKWSPVLNTEPIYKTNSAAKKAMKKLVVDIRKMDLSKEVEKLNWMLEEKIKE